MLRLITKENLLNTDIELMAYLYKMTARPQDKKAALSEVNLTLSGSGQFNQAS